MARLRTVLLLATIVQMGMAIIWFVVVSASSSTRVGTYVSLAGVIVASALALVVRDSGRLRRTAIAVHALVAFQWTVGLMTSMGRMNAASGQSGMMTVVILMTLALIVPCTVNACVLAMWPEAEEPAPAQTPPDDEELPG